MVWYSSNHFVFYFPFPHNPKEVSIIFSGKSTSSPGCIPHKSYAKDMPRVSKFHAKRLISGQNPMPFRQGMLFCYQLSCHSLAAKERAEDSGNFASRCHVATDMPAPVGMNVQARVTPNVVFTSCCCTPKTLISRQYAAKF